MLHVLFLILKIIGIFLAGILGIFLFLLLVVLFVPVRYKSEGSYYKTPLVNISLNWLLHIISIRVIIDSSGSKFTFKFFGIDPSKIKRISKKPNTSKKRKMKSIEKDAAKTKPKIPAERVKTPKETKAADEKQEFPQKQGFIKRILQKFKYTFIKFCDKLKALKKSFVTFIEFIKDEENKKTIKFIKKELFVILKHIKPKILKLNVRFGFNDPSNTGILLGILSMLRFLYKKNIQLVPDFENAIVEGEYSIRGRIYGITMLVRFIKLYFDKNLRRLVKQFMG